MSLLGKFWNRKAEVNEAHGMGLAFNVSESNMPCEWRTEHLVASPPVDISPLIYSANSYSCIKTSRVDKESGDVTVTGFSYYGDAGSADAVWLDILSMENVINSVGVKGRFGTDARLISPITAGVIPQQGQSGLVEITVNPLTKTGKPPKNAASVLVDATDRSSNGAIWHIDYLANGTVNKADVHFWHDRIRHSFNIRRQGGELVVIWAGTSDREGDEVTLYRRES